MRLIVAAVGLVLSIACAPRNGGNTTPEKTETGAAPVVTLERTACLGTCPVYLVSVTREGKISYEGKGHVRHLGPATASIPRERVDSLLSELEQSGYLSSSSRYVPGDSACGRYSTDSPSAITSIRVGEATKRIEHYYGCASAPGALVILEQKIDEALGSAQWTGR